MEIYLIQHGVAEPKDTHPERPLTARGRGEAIRTAARVAELEIQADTIWHSGKLRARQTADIFAESLRPAHGVIEHGGMAPVDDPGLIAGEIEKLDKPVVLVGHLPHLSRLSSLLVTGDADREIVLFRNAAIVCLGREEPGWRVRWVITPDLA